MPRSAAPTAEEIEREQAITRFNVYRAVKQRILNALNPLDPFTHEPRYLFTAEVEEKRQRILRYAQETLPFPIPLVSEEMYSGCYQPPEVKLPWWQPLRVWQGMGIVRQQPDGTWWEDSLDFSPGEIGVSFVVENLHWEGSTSHPTPWNPWRGNSRRSSRNLNFPRTRIEATFLDEPKHGGMRSKVRRRQSASRLMSSRSHQAYVLV